MPQRAIWLTAMLMTACSAEAPPLRVMVAGEAAQPAVAAPMDWLVQGDMAGEARSFFFGQAELYQAGANPESDDKLADVLRAMGREDLAGADFRAQNACPRQWVEPVEMIAQSADGIQVVIVESDRHAPAQTAFLEDLLGRLAADGFTAFADDGLTLGPGGEGHPDVLLVSEGLVTRDPTHGRLLREVKRLHLQLVDAGVWWNSPRELAELSPDAHLARRQAALALQVSRRAFARDPDVRIVIHTERSANPEAAKAFKAGIVSLTGQHPLLIALTDCASSGAPPAFLPGHGEGPGPGDQADLVFAIPQAATKSGRMTAGRIQPESLVGLPSTFLPVDKPVLVEARRASDPDLAVPEDRLILFPGDQLPLVLPPGDYRIEAWTRDGPLPGAVAVNVT